MMANDFTKARFRLVALYLVIIATIVILFSFLVIGQSDEAQDSAAAGADGGLVLSAEEVVRQAEALMPSKEVTDTEYEIERGDLYFTVEFEGETDVKGNLFTGEVLVEEDKETLLETLTDDFDEKVGWIGLAVFLIAACGSVYVANRTLTPISQNLRKQKQFVSGAAHELRNPLAALHSRIEAALRSRKHEASRNVLSDLLSETKRLIELSEKLLVIERDEERKRSTGRCSVEKSLQAVVERLRPLIEAKRLTIRSSLSADTVRIDTEDLETVLYNLIHNAIKFSPAGRQVRISWAEKTLTIEDEGEGISEHDMPHIFERFYTADTSLEGTGLGLSLVHDILARYKGNVSASSVVGKGTIFTISFSSGGHSG